MLKVQFLTIAGCHNCAEVKKSLEELRLEFPNLEIEEIDMATPKGQELVGKYQIMASPGIVVNGELFSTGPVSKEKLREKFRLTP